MNLTPAAPPAVDPDAVFRFIAWHMQERQRPPTLRDIAAACGISSTSMVERALRELERAGRIHIDQQRAAGIRLVNAPRCLCCGGIDYAALTGTRAPYSPEEEAA